MTAPRFTRLLACMLLALSSQAFSFECGDSLFIAKDTPPAVLDAKGRFENLTKTFVADSVVDSIFEVTIAGKSPEEVEKIVTAGQPGYFKATQQAQFFMDGFSQEYGAPDRRWKKTVKVTTHSPKGAPIVPYLQIFYEDQFGGVIRLKPNGNSDAPKQLTHLKRAHGTKYYKLNPNGDLSFENEAFKVDEMKALPKSPNQVQLPAGLAYGTPDAEAFLGQCWTYKTHVPLAE